MRVLVVYAHPNPQSFTHAVLERVERGLRDAGHQHEVIDLYAEGFDPVFSLHDATQFIHHSVAEDMFDRDALAQGIVDNAGNAVKRRLARRLVRGKSTAELVRIYEANQPADVRAHQAKVAQAEALVFVAPVFWMGFPAVLKGWLERVFAYGFAYTLTRRGWAGNLDGRVPLLSQRKALIITPTFFTSEEYDKGWREAMDTIICDWSLKMAGVQQAEHAYLHAVVAVDDNTRRQYLDRAYELAKAL